MKLCDGADKVCKYYLTYNGRAVCGHQIIRTKWSHMVGGSSWGNIKKAYLKQGGECKFYDGRAKKQV